MAEKSDERLGKSCRYTSGVWWRRQRDAVVVRFRGWRVVVPSCVRRLTRVVGHGRSTDAGRGPDALPPRQTTAASAAAAAATIPWTRRARRNSEKRPSSVAAFGGTPFARCSRMDDSRSAIRIIRIVCENDRLIIFL